MKESVVRGVRGVRAARKAISRREFLRVGGAGIAGAALLGAAGCGGGSGGGNGITYWASNQGATIQQDKDIISRVAKKFTDQTGVTVDFKVIPWTDLYNNILTATTSGEGPDVLNIGNTWSAALQATGAFLPFDGETMGSIGGAGKFLETSLAASGAAGETPTSVPLYGLSYGMFYNLAMFEEAGISGPPENWDDFVAVARELTGGGRWGVAVEGASITENAHWAFILGRQNGGSLFDEGGKPTFDSQPIVDAVRQYVSFIGDEKIAAPGNAEYADGQGALTDFSDGKAAMIVWQNNAMNSIENYGMKEDEYGVAKVPLPDPMPSGGEPIMTHVAGINISVFNNSQNSEAALDFVKFLTGEERQVELNQDFGSLPITRGAADDEAFQSEKVAVFNEILAENAEPMPLIPEEGEMETLIGDAVKQLFARAATQGSVSEGEVKSALTEANQKMAAATGG